MAILELACEGFESAKRGEAGGARRIELNAAMVLGGLTPGLGVVRRCCEETSLEVVAMLRCRPAGFCYSDQEFKDMLRELELLLTTPIAGVAFGVLSPDSRIDAVRMRTITERVHEAGRTAVCHRAFDQTPNPFEAMETLIACGVDRVLSSGQRATAAAGLDLLTDLQRCYGKEIELLPGCGVTSDNAAEILRVSGVRQIHASCKTWEKDPTTCGKISYGCPEAPEGDAYFMTDEAEVRRIVEAIKEL